MGENGFRSSSDGHVESPFTHPAQRVHMLQKLAEGLMGLHAHKIMHGDVRDPNYLVDLGHADVNKLGDSSE
jgi:hypothetical protein